MGMQGIKSHLGVHATSLTLRASRNDILASNIANAATPNFKARDIDFKAEFDRLEGIKGNLATTDPSHLPAVQPAGISRMQYRVPLNPSMDGNTVEMSVEQMQFSENVLRYQTSLSFINRKVSGLTSAIKGE
jgi:flagellar basal-body rod protein FlgB